MSEHFDSHNAAAAFDHDSTLVVALELSGKSWEVGAVVPRIARRPRRRFDPRDVAGLLGSLERWKSETGAARRTVSRVVLTYERSDGRRVEKKCVCKHRAWWTRYPEKKKK